MVLIERSRNFCGRYSANELRKFGNIAFYIVPRTNQYIAIRQLRMVEINGLYEVIMREYYKEPLYKQHMRMQMGQMPRNVGVNNSLRVRQLSEAELCGRYFEVYDTI